MKIIVKNLEGRTLTFEVDPDCTVEKLKSKIAESNGTQAGQQRIIFKGQQLREGKTLTEYKIVEGSELHLVVRSEGGQYYGYGPAIDLANVSPNMAHNALSY